MIEVLAPAKLNLFLHVTARREDGYHELESFVTFCDLADKITIREAPTFDFSMSGRFASNIDAAENLCVLAAQKLSMHTQQKLNVAIHLEKNIPVAAGLGGGSADAAAILKGLIEFYDLHIPQEKLQKLALSLGADVPVCLAGQTCIMRGIGENIELCHAPEFFIVLVNPMKDCRTEDVFSAFRQSYTQPLVIPSSFSNQSNAINFLQQTHNDLTVPAQEIIPEIQSILTIILQQKGCVLSRMTGSGATCFGVFLCDNAAKNAAYILSEQYPDYWVMLSQTI